MVAILIPKPTITPTKHLILELFSSLLHKRLQPRDARGNGLALRFQLESLARMKEQLR